MSEPMTEKTKTIIFSAVLLLAFCGAAGTMFIGSGVLRNGNFWRRDTYCTKKCKLHLYHFFNTWICEAYGPSPNDPPKDWLSAWR